MGRRKELNVRRERCDEEKESLENRERETSKEAVSKILQKDVKSRG